ncbi:MAG: FAD-binding and (Fe-S)-binding domain-containing protein [Myxococcota bacterium]
MATIPRLDQLADVQATYLKLLAALEREPAFGGEVRRDAATRLVSATDNSLYQLLPQAVVYPRSTADVAVLMRLLNTPEFEAVTVAPRGGGTGTNGQSLTEGLVLDLSRHMNAILDLDLEAGCVRVQPGVVLDDLNRHLAPHGVTFGPTLSPSSRATLGGMISTDAAGKGSRIHGRTSDHVLGLTTVFLGGEVWCSTPMAGEALTAVQAQDDFVGHLHREVPRILAAHEDAIREDLPKLKRFMTGYDLAHSWDGRAQRLDLSRLLAGSEGTLGVLTEATLRVVPIPTASRLVVLRYGSFSDALAHAQELADTQPGAIETVDETVVDLARKDIIWHRVGPLLDRAGEAPARAVNLVEYEGADVAAVDAQASRLLASVAAHSAGPGQPLGAYMAANETERAALWDLRKKGVGLLGKLPGNRKPSPFVEDTVVPPEHLPAYVAEFRALLEEAGVSYGMFGHIDVGCLHVRPALDMTDPEDAAKVRWISERVAELVQGYGGVLWGEHGKGFRAEFNPTFFGERLYGALRELKAVFDPTGRLNPGKITTPAGTDLPLASIDAPTRGALDGQIATETRNRWPALIHCNGNGACHNVDPDHIMCPSSKVTRDRIHSPKGRAGVMREWLRQLAQVGYTPSSEAPRPSAWWRTPGRLLRRLGQRLGRYDYSHDVQAAMEGCLACKACATQCPVEVDIPAFRAEFLHRYHGRYARPLSDLLIGGLEHLLPWMARAPRLCNAMLRNPLSAWCIEKLAGLTDLPALASPSADGVLKQRDLTPRSATQLLALDPEARARTVVLVQDAFTSFYEPTILGAAVDVLRHLGAHVEVLSYMPSGKGLHVRGFLGRFTRLARRNAAVLSRLEDAGLSMVALEPAVALAFRDEYPKALGGSGPRVLLIDEWLAASDAWPEVSRGTEVPTVRLFGHCTERALSPETGRRWSELFERLGASLEVARVGCCGMSGAYGHTVGHQEESRGIFEMSWRHHLTEDSSLALATGHSCRHQVARLDGAHLRHPLEWIAASLCCPAPEGQSRPR